MGAARSAGDRGAAAVEFALVVPLLLALMFGIVDYGLWFGDSLNARQGVDQGARLAVVNDFSSACTTGSAAQEAACTTKAEISSLSGATYVRVSVSGPGSKTNDWSKGAELLVCAVVKVDGLTGLTPMPDDSLIKSKATKRVEITNVPKTVTPYADAPPSGADWSWCT